MFIWKIVRDRAIQANLDFLCTKDCSFWTSEKFRVFYPTALKSGYCFHPWCPDGRAGGRVGGRREIVCPGCISENRKV